MSNAFLTFRIARRDWAHQTCFVRREKQAVNESIRLLKAPINLPEWCSKHRSYAPHSAFGVWPHRQCIQLLWAETHTHTLRIYYAHLLAQSVNRNSKVHIHLITHCRSHQAETENPNFLSSHMTHMRYTSLSLFLISIWVFWINIQIKLRAHSTHSLKPSNRFA